MTTAQRPATPDEVKALSHPLRLRILALCNGEALTNKELADRLQEQPATVLHHVRTLVRTGFLVAEEERPGPRGSTLRPYRATDKSWTIDIGGPTRSGSTKLAALDAAVTDMHRQPPDALGPLTLFSLRATRAQLEKLMDVLVSELELVDAQTETSTEPVWNVLITSYHSSA
jgi:predicted ArsR family transcriptional regulator